MIARHGELDGPQPGRYRTGHSLARIGRLGALHSWAPLMFVFSVCPGPVSRSLGLQTRCRRPPWQTGAGDRGQGWWAAARHAPAASRFPGCASVRGRLDHHWRCPLRHAAASFSRRHLHRDDETDTSPSNRRTPGRTGSRCMGVAGTNLVCAAATHRNEWSHAGTVRPRSLLREKSAFTVPEIHLHLRSASKIAASRSFGIERKRFLNAISTTSGTARFLTRGDAMIAPTVYVLRFAADGATHSYIITGWHPGGLSA